MPYKPKYCCQCGEKIDRVEWKAWTSPRFCELCATEFGIHDWTPRVLLGIALLFGLYGIGSYFQKPEKQLNVASSQFAVTNGLNDAPPKTAPQVSTGSGVQLPSPTSNSVSPGKTRTVESASDLKTKRAEMPVVESPEKVYFCGAQTKKGTMCSRRVKNGGRCWQHEGQPALLPQEKLIAAR